MPGKQQCTVSISPFSGWCFLVMSVRDCWNYPKFALLRSCLAVWTCLKKKKRPPQNIAVWTVWGIEKTKAPKSDASNFPRSQKQIKAKPGLSVVSRRSTTHQGLPPEISVSPVPVEPSRREERRKPTVPILPVVAGLWPWRVGTPIPGDPTNERADIWGFASTNEHPKAKCIGVPKYYIYIL